MTLFHRCKSLFLSLNTTVTTTPLSAHFKVQSKLNSNLKYYKLKICKLNIPNTELVDCICHFIHECQKKTTVHHWNSHRAWNSLQSYEVEETLRQAIKSTFNSLNMLFAFVVLQLKNPHIRTHTRTHMKSSSVLILFGLFQCNWINLHFPNTKILLKYSLKIV